MNHISYIQQNHFEMRILHPLSFIWLFVILMVCSPLASGQKQGRYQKAASARLNGWTSPVTEWHYPAILRIDSLKVTEGSKEINIWFPAEMSFNPVREETLARLVRWLDVNADTVS